MSKPKGNIAADDAQLIEKTVESETIFQGKVFTVELRKVELFDGSITGREIVKHNGGATICALDDQKNVFMVRQFRSPFETVMLEIPAGKLEQGEDPRDCAIRELQEETGMCAGNVVSLGYICSTPGYCSEKIYMFLATDLKQGEGNPDDGEFLQVIKMPLAEAVERVEKGEITDGKTVTALLKAARMVGV